MAARSRERQTGLGHQAWRVAAAWLLMAVVLGGLAAFFVAAQLGQADDLPGALLLTAKKTYWAADRWLLDRFLLNPYVIAIVAGAVVLEFLMPADRRLRKVSPGLVNDIVWHVASGLYLLTVMAVIYAATATLFARHLGFLSFDFAASWPAWARIAAGVAIADYLRWVSHYVRHKVPFLWAFHAVHHGQRELNVFSNFRGHPLEFVFSYAIMFLPLMMFQVDYDLTFLVVVGSSWFVNFYHANIRTNFGPLRHILVTPQFHRVHHSPLAEHRDTNYGVLFSIWDRLHGTRFPDAGIYPETGIEDPNFPVATGFAPGHQLATLVRQLAYPFYRVVGAEGPILPARRARPVR